MAKIGRSSRFGADHANIPIPRVGDISGAEGQGWGGARNATVSLGLTLKQVVTLHDAAERAFSAGLAFNRFVTVHWEALGVPNSDAARMTGRLIKLASDWCASKRVKMAWAWVRENDDGDGSRGSHVHMVLHCPASLPIGAMWRRWLKRLTGQPYRKGGVNSRAIGANLNAAIVGSNSYRANLAKVIDYMCKGATPEAAKALHLPKWGFGGRITGKRCSVWQRRTG